MRRLSVYFLALVFSLIVSAQNAPSALTNETVIKLVMSGVPTPTIIRTIETADSVSFSFLPGDLGQLQQYKIPDEVVKAMAARSSRVSPAPATSTASPVADPRQRDSKPRVFLQSASKGTNRNSARDQSMEMSKDLEKNCSDVRITINQSMADYTILLNHIEAGLLIRDNQIQVANRDGDLLTRTKEGGSIAGGMKKVCALILADWAKK